MNAIAKDVRDQAIEQVTPTVVAPTFGEFQPVDVDRYRYVHAANGMFLEGRSRGLYARLRLTPALGGPYGSVEPAVHLVGGPVPGSIRDDIKRRAREACPNEWAGLVVYDHESRVYRLIEPDVKSRSDSHITYTNLQEDPRFTLVVDVHSHERGSADFSPTDDASDTDGIYIAVVLGRCGQDQEIEAVTRVVVYGRFVPVTWTPWEES